MRARESKDPYLTVRLHCHSERSEEPAFVGFHWLDDQ